MRKLSFVLVVMALMMFVASDAFAQDEKPCYFVIKAGLNMSKFSGDDAEEESYSLGMAGGLAMGYKFSEMFTLMPEVLFMQKGSKETYPDGDVEMTWKFYYVDINVLAKVTVPTEGNIKPHFLAGPYLGIKASHGWSANVDVDPADEEEVDAMLDEYLKGTDFGLIFGAGIDYVLDSGHMITLEGRYGFGLTSIIDDDSEGESTDLKNNSITFLLGYSF
jgi:opacity protein-like surface antigen